MNLSADLREFIELLNSHGVEYVVAGAHSFAFHARPRYQLGRPPNRIDLLTGLAAISFDQAWASKINAQLGGVPVAYLSRELLIKNKNAVARPQDIADVAALEERD